MIASVLGSTRIGVMVGALVIVIQYTTSPPQSAQPLGLFGAQFMENACQVCFQTTQPPLDFMMS